MMKNTILTVLIFLCSTINGQGIKGVVLNVNNEPVSYASIALIEERDSSFIVGCITQKDGKFSLEETSANRILKVSAIGYHTQHLTPAPYMQITLVSQNTELGEVVVKGHRPTLKMNGTQLTANIHNTILSQLGDATDVLQQLPFIQGSGTSISVMGRGTPTIYINNRKMRDNHELQQLKSNMIKEVRIDMTPSAQYASDVNAVIYITTLRPVGEGLGGNFTLNGKQGREFTHNEMLNLNYRHNGLDVFLGTYFNRTLDKDKQIETYTFEYNKAPVSAGLNGHNSLRRNYARVTGGLNYTISQKQTLGLRYDYTPTWGYKSHLQTDSYFKSTSEDSFFSSETQTSLHNNTHTLVTYYENEITDKLSVQIDGTYMHSERDRNQTEEENRYETLSLIKTRTQNQADIAALKTTINTSLKAGRLTWGAEFTHTKSNQDYLVYQGSTTTVPSSESKSRQNSLNVFASYAKQFGDIATDVGIRYEHVNFNYYTDGEKREESRSYNNLFPSLSLSTNIGGLSLAAGYRVVIQQPSYSSLRSGIRYVNSYLYEEGNPALKPCYRHKISFMGSYRDLQFSIEHHYIKDDAEWIASMYQQEPIIYSSYTNVSGSGNALLLTYSPTINIWTQTIQGIAQIQHIKYMGRTYNHPNVYVAWKNLLRFPQKWIIVLNMEGRTDYDQGLYHGEKIFSTSIYATKQMKNWRFRCGINDLFHSQKDKGYTKVGNISKRYETTGDTQNIYLRITYTFNPAKSKYKGSTAGQSEIDRL